MGSILSSLLRDIMASKTLLYGRNTFAYVAYIAGKKAKNNSPCLSIIYQD